MVPVLRDAVMFDNDPSRSTYLIGKANDPCTLDGVLHRARPEVAQ